ncbi:shikimate kinase [Bryocella elongata]|nr:shikimate kinase [Bryocella elongata]
MSSQSARLAPAPAAFDRLVLTGFMGSGKTTIGALLAKHLGWTFLDLDHEIERRTGQTVPGLFAQHGESHFRRLESSALASVLGRRHVVIALGGGVPEELGNRLLLEQTPRTAVVYLEAPFEELLERCLRQPNATERPNLADTVLAAQRFARRQRHYEHLARFRVVTTGRTALETLDDVLAVALR